MKVCRKCGLRKPLDQFNKKTSSADGHRGECRSCQKYDSNLRYLRDPEKHKEKTRGNQRVYTAKKFGLTLGELEAMYVQQEGRCAICGISEEAHGKYLAIDHCHKTGKVRGLLCMPCNTALGNFKDDTYVMSKAIKYLEDNE
jgi:hypothetical protein